MSDSEKPSEKSITDILNREFQRRKEKNNRYSLRSFAAFLEVSPGFLSKLMKGNASGSVSTIGKLMRKIQATTSELLDLPEEVFEGSIYQAVKSLTFANGVLHASVANKAKMRISDIYRLNLPKPDIESALEQLLDRGIIEKRGDFLTVKVENLRNQLSSVAERKEFMKQVFYAWQRAFDKNYEEVKNINLIVKISDENLELIHKESIKFHSRIHEILERDKEEGRVYNISHSIFPLD